MKKTKATKATKHCISHSLAMQMVLMLAMHTVILLSVGPITNVVSASEHAPSSTEKSKRSTKDHDHDMLEMDNGKGSYRTFDQDRSGKEPPSLDLMEDSFTFSSLRGSERTVGKEEDNVKHADSEKSNRLTMHKVDIAKDAVNYIEHYLPSQEESESTPPSSEPGLGVELGERVGFVRRKSSSTSISLTPRQVPRHQSKALDTTYFTLGTLAPYSVSATGFGTNSNSARQSMWICPGFTIRLGTCPSDGGSYSGVGQNSMLRLYSGSGGGSGEIATGEYDPSCGYRGRITYSFTLGCRRYTLYQGCHNGYNACSGTTAVVVTGTPAGGEAGCYLTSDEVLVCGLGAPTHYPTETPTETPSSQPSRDPSTQPTGQPSSRLSLIRCPVGTELAVSWSPSGEESRTCAACARGRVSLGGGGTCSPCTAGSYSLGQTGECLPCSVGEYSSKEGSGQCTRCAAGFSAPSPASTSCGVCPAGSYSHTAAAECRECRAGFRSLEGSSKCEMCPPGTNSSAGSRSCTACPSGYYSHAGVALCLGCPAGFYSLQGSAMCQMCPSGTASNATAASCTSCPPGMFTPAGQAQCMGCAVAGGAAGA